MGRLCEEGCVGNRQMRAQKRESGPGGSSEGEATVLEAEGYVGVGGGMMGDG